VNTSLPTRWASLDRAHVCMGNQNVSSAMLTRCQYVLGVCDTCQCTSAGSAMSRPANPMEVMSYSVLMNWLHVGSSSGPYLSKALRLFRVAEVSQDCADLRGSMLLARLLRLQAAHNITRTSRLAHAVPLLLLPPMHVMGSRPRQTLD
jgi:hypothetical protein